MPSMPRELTAQLTKLRQSLRKIELRVKDEVAPAAVRAAAEVLHAAVYREAPVETGFLRSKIEIVEGVDEFGTFTLNVQVGAQDFVGKTFYAAMVEYGTDEMPANPFMQRAIDMDRDKAVAAAQQVFNVGLREILG